MVKIHSREYFEFIARMAGMAIDNAESILYHHEPRPDPTLWRVIYDARACRVEGTAVLVFSHTESDLEREGVYDTDVLFWAVTRGTQFFVIGDCRGHVFFEVEKPSLRTFIPDLKTLLDRLVALSGGRVFQLDLNL